MLKIFDTRAKENASCHSLRCPRMLGIYFGNLWNICNIDLALWAWYKGCLASLEIGTRLRSTLSSGSSCVLIYRLGRKKIHNAPISATSAPVPSSNTALAHTLRPSTLLIHDRHNTAPGVCNALWYLIVLDTVRGFVGTGCVITMEPVCWSRRLARKPPWATCKKLSTALPKEYKVHSSVLFSGELSGDVSPTFQKDWAARSASGAPRLSHMNVEGTSDHECWFTVMTGRRLGFSYIVSHQAYRRKCSRAVKSRFAGTNCRGRLGISSVPAI